MSTAADYADRQYDVMAFQNVDGSHEALLSQSLASAQGGTITVGIQKLAQRFLITLLQNVGSMPFQPSRGTAFVSSIRTGEVRTETDALAAFALAVGAIGPQLQSAETSDDPDDERFQDAELVNMTISPDQITLRINVISQAGDDRQIILPLATAL